MNPFPFRPMLIAIVVITVTGITAITLANIFGNGGC